MIITPTEIMSALGMTGGLWALVRWTQERHNGHNADLPNTEVHNSNSTTTQEIADLVQQQLMSEIAESNRNVVGLMGNVVNLLQQKPEPQPDPAWIKDLTQRMEAVIEMGPPTITVQAPPVPEPTFPPPPDLSEITSKLDAIHRQQQRISNAAPPPRTPRALPTPRGIPNPLPPIPSIPPAYVGGTVVVPGGSPQNLLLLIQQQLQPNCPGTCVQFRLEADSDMFVGAYSFYGGPLSASNFAYELVPGVPRIYQSAYPGSSTPIGDLQVLGAGALHVEVQL
jgi:hypothetical protein